MTTENNDNTAVSTATENSGSTQPKQRSVRELLDMDTYQGMTDAEIKSVIDWYVEQAHTDAEIKAKQAAIMVEMNNTAEAYAKAATESNDILKSLLTNDLKLTTIDSSGNVTNGAA